MWKKKLRASTLNTEQGFAKGFSIALLVFLLSASAIFGFSFLYQQIYPLKYEEYILEFSKEFSVPAEYIASISCVESHFDENAISSKGARGVMQILSSTGVWIAEMLGISNFELSMLFQPKINLRIGTKYFSYLLEKFGNPYLAVVAYNAGEGNVKAWLGETSLSENDLTKLSLPFKETSDYVKRVESKLNHYKKILNN